MNITGAIFDLDGTLLDSMPFWENVGARYLERHGVAATDDLTLRLKTMTLMESAQFFRADFGITESVETICRQISGMIEEDYRSHAPLKRGARTVLDALYARGIPMCIATATDHRLVQLAVDRLGLAHFFQQIVTCGDWNTSKNQPYLFQRCARELGSPVETTVVFEDSLHSIRTAVDAGFPVIGIYDASARGEEGEIRALCAQYLTDWEDFTFT